MQKIKLHQAKVGLFVRPLNIFPFEVKFLIYDFKRCCEITANKISRKNLTLVLVSESEFEVFAKYFPCGGERQSEIRCDKNEYFFTINTVRDENGSREIHISIKENLLIITGSDSETNEIFQKTIKSHKTEISPERLICDYLLSVTHNDSRRLDETENRISLLEDVILTEKSTKNINYDILKIKRKLLRLRQLYEQLSDICGILQKNENNFFDNKNLTLFEQTETDIQKLVSKVDLLRDSLTQLREAYQESIDLNLNNTMKVFTVVATIFLPLTLLTGWYGMNFKFIPELQWKYGYIYVIALSVIIAVSCIIYFKKKKLL